MEIALHYYPFHLGDYSSHTAHLTPLEDIAYRRLLDFYYQHEQPPTGTPAQVARIIRMRDHADIVDAVLCEFFIEETVEPADNPVSTWRHTRCEQELAIYHAQVEGGKAGADARWGRHRERKRTVSGGDAPPMPPLSGGDTHPNQGVMPTMNHEPRTMNHEPRNNKAAARPDAVSEDAWRDFLTLRKAKRAPVTASAVERIEREAQKAGITLQAALEECCLRGWTGFRADWMARRMTAAERAAETVARLTGKRDRPQQDWRTIDADPLG